VPLCAGVLAAQRLPLFRRADNVFVVEIPVLIGGALMVLLTYRGDRGFWPWDLKRRKIARWRWLVETDASHSSPSDEV